MTRFVGFLAIFMALVVSRSSMAAPSCNTVVLDLMPCLDFLKGGGLLSDLSGEPSQACCKGIKGISKSVKSKDDRSAACQCIKQALSSVGSYNPARIPLLPKKCGASITFPPIDRNTDCSKAMFNHDG